MALTILSKNRLGVFVALLFCCSVYEGTVLAMPSQQLSASPTGQVQLTVMDQNGLPLAQAFVIVQQNNKTVVQERTTPTGIAIFRQLPPGKYKLMVEKQGF